MSKKIKVHSLTGRITPLLMMQAFKAVKKNRGAAGVDKVSVQMFEANLEQNLEALMRELKKGSFQARPLRRVYIPKGPHQVIMNLVAEEVADGNILRLIQRFLKAGVMEDGVFKPTTVGTPQGGVISPLLANIVLNKLDWHLDHCRYRFVRYADDFLVITQSRQQSQEALAAVRYAVEGQLGLELSSEKTHFSTYGKGYEFLGFFISSRSRAMRDKSVKKFKEKVRELTQRHHNLDAKAVVKLNQVIRGTANYFATSFSTTRWFFQKVDSWIRMRLRCMKTKRKNYSDNRRISCGYFARVLGLLSMEGFCTFRDAHGEVHRVIPRRGQLLQGVAR